MRALILAGPMVLLGLSQAVAGGPGWGGARTEVVWTGAYLGLQAGYSRAEIDQDRRVTNTRTLFDGRDLGDVSGGFYAGYMKQLSNDLVVGFEADLNVTDLRETQDVGFRVNGVRAREGEDGDYETESVSDQLKWTGGFRGRLGLASGAFHPYVTAGLAGAKYRGEGVNEKLYGWSLGAGLEYAATERIIARLEYRYADYGDVNVKSGERPSQRETNLSLTTHDIRAGVALKF